MGYSHFEPEIYIGSPNDKPVKISDVYSLNDSSSGYGNEQWIMLDAESHRWYFNKVTSCYNGGVFDAMFPSSMLSSSNGSWVSTMLGMLGYGSKLLEVH